MYGGVLMATQDDPFRFTGLEPFDEPSRLVVVERTHYVLESLQIHLNAPVEMPPPGVDIEVPEVDWKLVEEDIMSSLATMSIEDLIRMLAYWAGKWNTSGEAAIAMDRAAGRGIPVETYTLMARCCANAIIRKHHEE